MTGNVSAFDTVWTYGHRHALSAHLVARAGSETRFSLPDDSGEHLWAVFLDDEVSRISLLYDTTDELLDAQAAATIEAFAQAEAERRVGNNGSGGVLR
jgi:hypothetical protein